MYEEINHYYFIILLLITCVMSLRVCTHENILIASRNPNYVSLTKTLLKYNAPKKKKWVISYNVCELVKGSLSTIV